LFLFWCPLFYLCNFLCNFYLCNFRYEKGRGGREEPREAGKGWKERKGEGAKEMCSLKIALKELQHRLRSPFRPHGITALRSVPNYTAWRQMHIKWCLTRPRFLRNARSLDCKSNAIVLLQTVSSTNAMKNPVTTSDTHHARQLKIYCSSVYN